MCHCDGAYVTLCVPVWEYQEGSTCGCVCACKSVWFVWNVCVIVDKCPRVCGCVCTCVGAAVSLCCACREASCGELGGCICDCVCHVGLYVCVCVSARPSLRRYLRVRCGEGCDHVCMGLFLCESVCVCLCLCMCVGVCHVKSVSATESAQCVSVCLCGL